MALMKRPRLKAVQPRLGACLELTFTNGQHFILDMSGALKTYPGLAPLSKRKAFEGATLGDAGWSVEWPELDIQIGADTLLLDPLTQNARMKYACFHSLALATSNDPRSSRRGVGRQRSKH